MKNVAKKIARYLVAVLSLSLLVTVAAAVMDLHDFRILLGVVAGMAVGEKLVELAKKIPHLEE